MVGSKAIPELKCRTCEDWMLLEFEDYTLQRGNVSLLIRECPILKCPSCKFSWPLANDVGKEPRGSAIDTFKSRDGFAVVKIPYTADPGNRYQLFDPAIFDGMSEENKKYEEIALEIPKQKFSYCKLEFLYDLRDYYYIPGLYRSSADGFLTPVFFKKKVLLKYIHNAELDFSSDTYGTIYPQNNRCIAFGINRNDRVVIWLGDIDKLSEKEQYYLRSENVASDHDVASEFYQGQIEIIHTQSSKEKLTLRARHEMVKTVFERFNVKVAHLDLESVPVMKGILRPIIWERQCISPVIDAMNKIMIEGINNKDLKADILRLVPNLDLTDCQGIELFQRWLTARGISGAKKTVSPLRALNRLRILFAHLLPTKKEEVQLTSACKYLVLPPKCRDWEKIYDALIEGLHAMYKKIAGDIASLPNDNRKQGWWSKILRVFRLSGLRAQASLILIVRALLWRPS